MLATEAPKTPAIRCVVNILPQAASAHSTDGVPTASLDHEEEEEEEAFHKFHQCRMMQCSPTSQHMDPMWQTTKWLQVCEEGLDDEEISWWLLVSPLTDGSNMAMKDLARQLVAAWRWSGKVSKTPICLPSPTVLNIGQFLDEDAEEKGWDQQQWLLAYAHTLQRMGETADGRTWRPNGVQFTPQVSQLVDAFIDRTWVELVEAEAILCWNELPWEVPCQRDEGIFAEVISCLDQLAKCLPTSWAWNELVFPPPPAKPHMPHRSGHLGYIRGCVVALGQMLPSLRFCVSEPDIEFICMAWGVLFEGSVLAYDPTTNGAEWIPVQGSASNLSPVEEASTQELSNIVPHDPSKVPQRMDHFGEQRGESSMQETMELGYQPGSEGDAGSDSLDGPHCPRCTMQCSSSSCLCQSSVSWADQSPSKSNDQHVPWGAGDASC